MLSNPHNQPASETVTEASPPGQQFRQRLSAVLFILFCLELGLFLVIFPWSEWWEFNFFASLAPEWHRYWTSSYFRGAVSGLGVLNLYISFTELLRIRRFSRR